LGFQKKSPIDWNKPLEPGPLELGFDYYFGIPIVNSHPPFVYVENHHVVGLTADDPFVYGKKAETREFDEKFGLNAIGGAKAAHALYDDEKAGTTLTAKAIEWMKKQKQPFFLYLATTNIHHPFTPAPRFRGTSQCGRYGDFIHELDWIVGQVTKTLDEMGVADNTLVIFTSDNGPMLNRGGQAAWRAGHHMNGDLLGSSSMRGKGGTGCRSSPAGPAGFPPAQSRTNWLAISTSWRPRRRWPESNSERMKGRTASTSCPP
jgi:arylsulfatase A